MIGGYGIKKHGTKVNKWGRSEHVIDNDKDIEREKDM